MLKAEEIIEINAKCVDRCEMYKILIKYMRTEDYEEVLDVCCKRLIPIIRENK